MNQKIISLLPKKEEVFGGTFADNQIQIGKNLMIDEIVKILSTADLCVCPSEDELAKTLGDTVCVYIDVDGCKVIDWTATDRATAKAIRQLMLPQIIERKG